MQKIRLFPLLVSGLMLFSSVSFASDSPIWVDGNGNIISGPDSSSSSSSTTDTVIIPEESTEEDAEEDLTPDEGSDTDGDTDTDDSSNQKWVYESQTLTATLGDETVEVLAVGTRVSIIQRNGAREEVYTDTLRFAEDVEAGKQLAIITAPKSGQASMFKKASGKSAIIMKCQTGRIVPVLAVTKNFALVQYKDAVGYVKRSSLTFLDADSGEATFAYIAYKGKTSSNNTVKVRQKASSNGRILDEFPCGQRVTVIAPGEKWTEIEVENLRCYILSEFLTTVDEADAVNLPVRGIGSSVHAVREVYASLATGTDLNE
ncbi:MAG: SH3 domain-containing protein [Clostridia bacterium]|nr:SH3 domain-containing protein [Clostridia bacterium]